jgi:chaperonin cofactor prefoldin
VLEGADTVEGSVAKALKDAKAYTDLREVEINKYADQAEADAVATAKGYTDTEVKKASDAAAQVASDLSAHTGNESNPHKVTKEQVGLGNVDNKSVAEIKTEFTGAVEADNAGFVTGGAAHAAIEAAKTAANTYADGLNTAMDTRVDTLEAAKTAQDTKNGELAQAIADEKSARETAVSDEATARENADNAINAKIGTVAEGKTVVGLIGEAQAAAEATAASDAAAKVKALADGQVATNASKITELEQAIADEADARSTKDENLEGRLVKVEAFFDPKDAEGNSVDIDKALDTLVEIQKYITEDGSAAGEMVEDIEANAKAIENLSKEFIEGGRVTVAEAAIDQVEADVADIEATLTGYDKDHTVSAAIEAAQGAAQTYADGKASAAQAAAEATAAADATTKANAAQAAAEATAAGALSSAVETLNAKDADLAADIATKLTATEFTGWKATHEADHAKTATEITAEINAAVAAEAELRVAADNAINAKIGTIAEGATVAGLIDGVKTTAEDAQTRVAALEPKVEQAEKDIDALQAIVSAEGGNSNAQLRSDIDALEAIVVDGDDGNVKLGKEIDDLAAEVHHQTTGLAATKAIADAAKKAAEDNASDIDNIQADYLKKADLFIINCGTSTTVIHEEE